MTAKRIKYLRSIICRYKVWISDGSFGRFSYRIYSICTKDEPKPDAVIYGLNFEDALERYNNTHPFSDKTCLVYKKQTAKNLALIAVLPYNSKDQRQLTYWH